MRVLLPLLPLAFDFLLWLVFVVVLYGTIRVIHALSRLRARQASALRGVTK